MRIVVADKLPKVRFALKVLPERQTDRRVVGETGHADELLVILEEKHPHLLLLGWDLPGMAPDAPVAAFRTARLGLGVIALSGIPDARRCALEAGADAFVRKSDPPERLLSTIDRCDCHVTTGAGADAWTRFDPKGRQLVYCSQRAPAGWI